MRRCSPMPQPMHFCSGVDTGAYRQAASHLHMGAERRRFRFLRNEHLSRYPTKRGEAHPAENSDPAPEAARTCEGCEAMPEQSVGDNRATQLIGAQRRVKSRVRASAALNREMLAPGWQAAFLGKAGPRATQPGRVPGVPWNYVPRGLGCQQRPHNGIKPPIWAPPAPATRPSRHAHSHRIGRVEPLVSRGQAMKALARASCALRSRDRAWIVSRAPCGPR